MTNNFRAQLVHLHLGPTTFTLALHGLTSSYACSTNFLCPWLTAPFTSRSYSPSSRTRAEVSTRCKASSPQTLWITRITANVDRFYTLFRNPQPHCSKNKPRRRQHILHAELAEQLQLDVSFQVAYCEAAYTCQPVPHPEEHPHGLLFFPQRQGCKHVHLHVLQEVVDTANYLSRGWV